MQAKHTLSFDQLTATFRPSLIKKWTAMVAAWEADPTQPNPYEEPENCELTCSSAQYILI